MLVSAVHDVRTDTNNMVGTWQKHAHIWCHLPIEGQPCAVHKKHPTRDLPSKKSIVNVNGLCHHGEEGKCSHHKDNYKWEFSGLGLLHEIQYFIIPGRDQLLDPSTKDYSGKPKENIPPIAQAITPANNRLL